MWARRAVTEFKEAAKKGGRSWFITLTFRQEEHYKLQAKARQRLAKCGADLDAMRWEERYGELLKEYHAQVDLFLQRLRNGLAKRGWDEARFRYLMVPEPHKNGNIHYHVLLHEAPAKGGEVVPIGKRRIEAAWGHGFISAKLVQSEEAALYVTKYLGKHHYEGRIRNSKHYGAEGEDDQEAQMKQPALPYPTFEKARTVPPPDRIAEQGLRIAAAELAQDEDSADEVRAGEYLGVCPSGLHIGTGCDCMSDGDELQCSPAEIDPYRGVPRRKWALRGWHEPVAGRGAPGLPRPYKRRKSDEDELGSAQTHH